MENYSNVLILGAGRSGLAAERLLQSEGARTTMLSEQTVDLPDVERMLAEAESDRRGQDRRGHRRGQSFDLCVVSPGFASDHPWVERIRRTGVPLLSELELGWSRHGGKTIAVTGSNGKSSAVKWICEALQCAGCSAAIGGNYGIPVSQVVQEQPELDWLVLEVSSFQLETVHDFYADIAVLLNLLPNHLDRHGTMKCYRQVKARIFGTLESPSLHCIAPQELLETLEADVGVRNWIGVGDAPRGDCRYEDGLVLGAAGPLFSLEHTPFGNPILGRCTGAAVGAVAEAAGIPFEAVAEAARSFKPLPHRLQHLGELEGVLYVDDSKATNLAATAAALHACGDRIHLIAGGLPKESDYTFIKEVLAERVRSIYLIGQASRAMYNAWRDTCLCVECGTLEEAFRASGQAARAGETILLSPGCASFDQFQGFEARGNCFQTLFQAAGGRDDAA